jgi:hypothetical protein
MGQNPQSWWAWAYSRAVTLVFAYPVAWSMVNSS